MHDSAEGPPGGTIMEKRAKGRILLVGTRRGQTSSYGSIPVEGRIVRYGERRWLSVR